MRMLGFGTALAADIVGLTILVALRSITLMLDNHRSLDRVSRAIIDDDPHCV